MLQKEGVMDKKILKMLYPREDVEKVHEGMWKKRKLLVMVVLMMIVLMWLYCFLQEPKKNQRLQGNTVKRGENDEGVELVIHGDDGKESWEKEITLQVNARKYTKKEKREITKKVREYIDAHILGENVSFDHIKTSLVLNQSIKDYEDFHVSWTVDERYVKEDGSIRYGNIEKEGQDTEILLEIKEGNYRKSFYYPIHIDAPELDGKTRMIRATKKEIQQILKKTKYDDEVTLPEQIEDFTVQYSEKSEEKSYLPVYIFIAVGIILPFVWKEQEKKELEKRREQMMSDHPGFVNKVMLLLGAGLTLRRTMERMVSEYERERKRGEVLHYVYEEVCIMLQEMKDGLSETQAIERFGKRCQLMPYIRFSSVIGQNLKKGSEGIIEILEQESMEALIQRKERALQKGEKAGTKLLLPMVIMLGVVMGIIMIPAFMTM